MKLSGENRKMGKSKVLMSCICNYCQITMPLLGPESVFSKEKGIKREKLSKN